jgi:sigma-B regulation protein RsbU (phosphoserine phosphatase)
LGLVIADVTGKGVPAALMMASARAILRTTSARGCSPKEVLERANQLIAVDNRARLFLSAFYATLDPNSGHLIYANGGHERPYWLRASNGECQELTGRGVLLGAFQNIDLEQREIQIDPGDLLVFYTDGITEARGPSGEMFEEERPRQLGQCRRALQRPCSHRWSVRTSPTPPG